MAEAEEEENKKKVAAATAKGADDADCQTLMLKCVCV